MSRRSLVRSIDALDTRLNARQVALAEQRLRLRRRVQRISPLYWAGAALLLGVVLGRQDAQGSLRIARSGLRVFSLLQALPGLKLTELLQEP